MARDPQAALVALNCFGFGARSGAAGDFANAASDPRGFVKAELSRPNGGLLEVPDLRAVIKGVLHDHLGLAERLLADTIFPDSAPVKPMKGLVG